MDFRIKLDNNIVYDAIDGLDELILSVIRESGFGNSEQILRDDVETQFQFTGDGFKYICQKRKDNYCEEILCTIEALCDNGEAYILFDGLIKQNKVEVLLKKCICKVTNLKDNSFSGLIRDFINIEIPLFYTKTKNCEQLNIPVILINTPTTPSTYTITDIKTFDCLDIFKYIVAFYTDNRITVKSDYLTNNKYAITTGYNMHNYNGGLENQYPKLSIELLFNELRKKCVLYKSVEYETDGTPYLRIENEDYFFTNDELLVIGDIPLDAVEKIDKDKLFNDIKIGSKTIKLKDDTTPIVQQNRFTAWNEETYIGCGGCSGEKDSTLELVSSFIIDANIIHEAMNQAENSDYDHDDKIFLLHYYNTGYENKLVGNNTSNYNAALNNENTLNRWVGVSNSCITISRFYKYGFKVVNPFDLSSTSTNDHIIHDGYAINNNIITSYLGCKEELYDQKNAVSYIDDITTYAGGPNYLSNGKMSLFTCQENGQYKFRGASKIIEFIPPASTTALYMPTVNYRIRFVVFLDNTLTTIISTGPTTNLDVVNLTAIQTVSTFDIISPSLNLSVGNVVCIEISIDAIGIFYQLPFDYYHIFCDSVFELLEDNTSCEDLKDNTDNFKPFLTEFEYPICLEDYLKMKQNKRGYILLNGQKTWLKKIQYKPSKKSNFIIMYKESFCGCAT